MANPTETRSEIAKQAGIALWQLDKVLVSLERLEVGQFLPTATPNMSIRHANIALPFFRKVIKELRRK